MWTLYSQCACSAFRRDNREDKRLLSVCLFLFVSNTLSLIEGFSFMANIIAWCVRECDLLLSYPVPRLNSNLHFGKPLA